MEECIGILTCYEGDDETDFYSVFGSTGISEDKAEIYEQALLLSAEHLYNQYGNEWKACLKEEECIVTLTFITPGELVSDTSLHSVVLDIKAGQLVFSES